LLGIIVEVHSNVQLIRVYEKNIRYHKLAL